jgi:hypothetical protein
MAANITTKSATSKSSCFGDCQVGYRHASTLSTNSLRQPCKWKQPIQQ